MISRIRGFRRLEPTIFASRGLAFGREFAQKTVVLVGNREPTADLSEAIEAHDFVFRFSYMTHIRTGLIGTRTDGIHIEATSGYRENLSKNAVDFCNAGLLKNVRLVTMRRLWYSPEVLSALDLANRRAVILDDEIGQGISRPTSGFRLIVAMMNLPVFCGSRLSICGFTTEVDKISPDLRWHQESLAAERIAINRLIQRGTIRCLDAGHS